MAPAPIALRVTFLAASAAVHGVVFVAMGHASALSQRGPTQADVLVPNTVSTVVVDVEAEPEVAKPSGLVPPHAHKHSYPVPLDHDAHPHDPSLVHVPLPLRPIDTPTRSPAKTASPPIAPVSGAPATFAMTVSASTLAPVGASQDPGELVGGENARQPLAEDAVSEPARLLGTISPAYPPIARARELEADVDLWLVVTRTGEVRDAHVVRPVGFGFDEAALRAVQRARFAPATHDGKICAVRMHWTVSFRLR